MEWLQDWLQQQLAVILGVSVGTVVATALYFIIKALINKAIDKIFEVFNAEKITNAIAEGTSTQTAAKLATKTMNFDLTVYAEKKFNGFEKRIFGACIEYFKPVLDKMNTLQDVVVAIGTVVKDTKWGDKAARDNLTALIAPYLPEAPSIKEEMTIELPDLTPSTAVLSKEEKPVNSFPQV